MNDSNVVAPKHYTAGGIEVIDIIEAKLTKEEYIGYLKGNIIKYTLRSSFKGNLVQDMEKADVYKNWLLQQVIEEDDEIDPKHEALLQRFADED
jgi:hypothetical protein